jgi:hypothetical protein
MHPDLLQLYTINVPTSKIVELTAIGARQCTPAPDPKVVN